MFIRDFTYEYSIFLCSRARNKKRYDFCYANRQADKPHKYLARNKSVINDTFGHNSGDMCLKSVASAIRKVYRKSGLCYRVGGDEFCVIINRKADFCKIEDLNADNLRLGVLNRIIDFF